MLASCDRIARFVTRLGVSRETLAHRPRGSMTGQGCEGPSRLRCNRNRCP